VLPFLDYCWYQACFAWWASLLPAVKVATEPWFVIDKEILSEAKQAEYLLQYVAYLLVTVSRHE